MKNIEMMEPAGMLLVGVGDRVVDGVELGVNVGVTVGVYVVCEPVAVIVMVGEAAHWGPSTGMWVLVNGSR